MQYIGKYGDDGPDGPKTLLNLKTLQELKFDIFTDDQKKDKKVRYQMACFVNWEELTGKLQFNFSKSRQVTAFAESGFTLELFQDGVYRHTDP